ncbi:hypothetical protein [Cutibacterium avidum]|uniref:hypothetical protein n=1 Tax=Cutibacterium avidum TaxID=33010 RepID=UPI0003B8D25C|nr:hypothetical protein [Cutibacterium avidum]ERS24852.1 hypothetical protein HMPREF1301_00237 [Propionibacterium sp. KPL2005]ERS26751.1 hypothetical protein HMPREF1297_02341 [Propionibacterium sp. KPL2000]MDU1018181.1 hypothetical protein [Clostridium perfringens]MDU2365895.1 hypothetical protein [Klebsiella michiganensis]MCO6658686.1 hypothetical protein [Cutibacterium avidum]
MIDLRLSDADRRAFEAGLLADHRVRTRVDVLDLDHNLIATAEDGVLSGSVDVDIESDVSRTCQLELRDPDGKLNLDAQGPAQAALYADRMIRVFYGVWSEQLPQWVDVPVFTGPITSIKRNSDSVSLSASGKESFLTVPQSRNWIYDSGTRKTDIISQVLSDSGEEFRSIPRWSDKVTSTWQCLSNEAPWQKLQQLSWTLASRKLGTDPLLFYDGRGRCRLKSYVKASAWTFRRGVDMLTEPDISSDLSNIRNFVVVHGGVPKGSKRPVYGTATLPSSHPLSPKNLSRGGVPRYLREQIDNQDITSSADARAIAKHRLNELGWAFVDLAFDVVPVPHLEPRDIIAVDAGEWTWRMALMKFSIPLTADGHMTISRHTHVRRMTRRVTVARKGSRR